MQTVHSKIFFLDVKNTFSSIVHYSFTHFHFMYSNWSIAHAKIFSSIAAVDINPLCISPWAACSYCISVLSIIARQALLMVMQSTTILQTLVIFYLLKIQSFFVRNRIFQAINATPQWLNHHACFFNVQHFLIKEVSSIYCYSFQHHYVL